MRVYVKGAGFVKKYRPGKDCLYMEKWLERDTITPKEYNRFLKELRKLEGQRNVITHRMSILERIILKLNKPGDDSRVMLGATRKKP